MRFHERWGHGRPGRANGEGRRNGWTSAHHDWYLGIRDVRTNGRREDGEKLTPGRRDGRRVERRRPASGGYINY
jgi:hypothetical protein